MVFVWLVRALCEVAALFAALGGMHLALLHRPFSAAPSEDLGPDLGSETLFPLAN